MVTFVSLTLGCHSEWGSLYPGCESCRSSSWGSGRSRCIKYSISLPYWSFSISSPHPEVLTAVHEPWHLPSPSSTAESWVVNWLYSDLLALRRESVMSYMSLSHSDVCILCLFHISHTFLSHVKCFIPKYVHQRHLWGSVCSFPFEESSKVLGWAQEIILDMRERGFCISTEPK